MTATRMAAGGGLVGAGAMGYAAMDKLLEHGDLGVLMFGTLAMGGILVSGFTAWLGARRPRP